MGGKNRHSQDRLFITATEWKSIGGKRVAAQHDYRPLPFDHCAMSLSPYETPCCTANEGVVFDVTNLVPYVMKHKKNPITGEKMSTSEIIRLNMSKNAEGLWHCPVTCKVFNNNTHVVAIKTTGNVFSFDAVNELNIKAKNYTDLLSGEKFIRSDVIVLQDHMDPAHMARRDINSFVHLKQIREDNKVARQTDSKVRHNPVMGDVMKELELKRSTETVDLERNAILQTSSTAHLDEKNADDVRDLLALNPTTEDVNPGRQLTTGQAGSSLTSSSSECWTGNAVRRATVEELREARWKKMKQVGKKGYVQLQTSIGNLNLELHCDIAMRATWNFITLCERGYYDGTPFHRLVPGFMLQGGDPTGTGSGGESAWGQGRPFRDNFDARILHDARGVLSMANSGLHSNKSQFFITMKATSHLDYKHTVFGRLVGGAAVLDRIEAVGADKKEKPLQEIILIKATVFTNPVDEADKLLLAEIAGNIKRRLDDVVKTAVQIDRKSSEGVKGPIKEELLIEDSSSSAVTQKGPEKGPVIGKYMAQGNTEESNKKAFMDSAGTGDSEPSSKKPKTASGYSNFSAW